MSTPNEVAADMTALATATRARVAKVVVAHGNLLQAAVKRRANQPRTAVRPGQPGEGPRRLTGAYQRSIQRRTIHRATRSSSHVGTNAVQARRLEFGFVGTDSLGRTYDQQAYPHFGPALDEAEAPFIDAVHAAGLPEDR